MRDVYGGNPELLSLVLMGALAVMEDDAPAITRMLQEQKKERLAHSMESVMTALRWASLQLDHIAFEQK